MKHFVWNPSERLNTGIKIGHLRGDFGRSGEEFWTSWFDYNASLKKREFRDELQLVVDDLRKKDCLLSNFNTMRRLCRSGYDLTPEFGRECYGFNMETEHYRYYIRCIPNRGDYNFYMDCFAKR